MPGSAREVSYAEEEGVNFSWLSTPLKINGSSKVETIEVAKVELGKQDSSGRSSPNVLVNDTYRLKADIVDSDTKLTEKDLTISHSKILKSDYFSH